MNRSYLVTLQSGRMILIENAFGPGIAKVAAYRKAESLGMRPEVRSVSVVTDDTAALIKRQNA